MIGRIVRARNGKLARASQGPLPTQLTVVLAAASAVVSRIGATTLEVFGIFSRSCCPSVNLISSGRSSRAWRSRRARPQTSKMTTYANTACGISKAGILPTDLPDSLNQIATIKVWASGTSPHSTIHNQRGEPSRPSKRSVSGDPISGAGDSESRTGTPLTVSRAEYAASQESIRHAFNSRRLYDSYLNSLEVLTCYEAQSPLPYGVVARRSIWSA